MKKYFITFSFLLAGLFGFANNAPVDYRSFLEEGLTADHPTLLLENPVSGEVQNAVITTVIPPAGAFVNCTIKISMEINGVEVEGKLTIYDVSLLECAVIKVAKFFSDIF